MSLPFKFKSPDEAYRQIALTVNSVLDGHVRSTAEITLTASVTTTVITDVRCHTGSVVLLMPKAANAAAELATLYITPIKGSFTITHANNAQTDRTFNYCILG